MSFLLIFCFTTVIVFAFLIPIEKWIFHSVYHGFQAYAMGSINYFDNKNSFEFDNSSLLKSTIGLNTSQVADFTLLIYMIGSTLEDKSYEATKDINELINGRLNNSLVNVVLETGGSEGKPDKIRKIDFSTIQRHLLVENGTAPLNYSGPHDSMGKSETLSEFIKYGISTFPAEKYGLVLWDHGQSVQGFGEDVNFRDKHNRGDSLTLNEIQRGIFEGVIPLMIENPDFDFDDIEFIGFDSCLMGSIEVASFLTLDGIPFANYLIASQEIEPNWGWNYTDIVESISSNSSITGDLLGKKIIESFKRDSDVISKEKKFYANRDITLSVIDLKRIPSLYEEFNDLINTTQTHLDSPQSLRWLLKSIDSTESFGKSVTRSYGMIDANHFLTDLGNVFPALKNKVEKVKNEIDAAVVHNYSGASHPNAQGLSVFLPLSKKDFSIIDTMGEKNANVTASNDWWNFLTLLYAIIDTDKFPPMVQSSSDGKTIDVYVPDPDIKRIFITFSIPNSNGDDVHYAQNLDPALLNETGFFTYSDPKMLSLCNERLCVPVTMTMDSMRDLKKIFIPVEIKSGKDYKDTTLVYEFQKNKFVFIGGINNYEVKGGNTEPKEKVNLNPGDIISPVGIPPTERGAFLFDKVVYVNDTTTVLENLQNIFNKKFYGKSLTVTDPTQILPKFIDVNQSAISIIFCDFADLCEQTRKYQFDDRPANDENIHYKGQDKEILILNSTLSTKNSNLTYVDMKHEFQLQYPQDWFSIFLNPDLPSHARIYENDPIALSLYPKEIISNSNGTINSLNGVTITVTNLEQKNLKEYYDCFTKNINSGDICDNASKKIIDVFNASETTINGYDAFEFMQISQDNVLQPNGTEPIAYEYWVTTYLNGKEYVMQFSSEKSQFERYLPVVKKIFSSFGPIDQDALQNSNDSIGEKYDIVKIREILASKSLKNVIWKDYIDHNLNFSISYPYLDRSNNPEIDHDYRHKTLIKLPTVYFFEHPYKDPLLSITSGANLTDKTMRFNPVLLQSYDEQLNDGLLSTVKEYKYFLPLISQTVYEKEGYILIGNRNFTISMIVAYEDRSLYEPIFDKIIKSFKLSD